MTTHESYPNLAISILNHELPGEDGSKGDDPLLALYALLAMTKGTQTTLGDVHDAWSLWTALTRKKLNHRCLVPFEELSMDDQDLDRPYLAAIHRTAKRLDPRFERAYAQVREWARDDAARGGKSATTRALIDEALRVMGRF